MKITIVVIGDEILLGQVTDTNSGEIARCLGPMGWEVVETIVVGDDHDRMVAAIDKGLQQSDLVITTGGLGPTKDDITKQAMLDVFGGTLREDPDVLRNVERVFEKRGLPLNALTRTQAMVPTTCQVVQNRFGTAPIMWFEHSSKVLVAMPGVPFETVGMLHAELADMICRRFSSDRQFFHHTLIASGLPESALAEKLAPYEQSLPAGMHLAYLPNPGYIRLRLDGSCPVAEAEAYGEKFDLAVGRLKSELGPLAIYDGDATVAQIVLARLSERGYTLATAESCTGGNIAHQITSVPGSSEWYMGSVVSYSNGVKAQVLGVSTADIQQNGAVSEPVVRQMAEGAARVIGTDCAVATSGIAGPGGGTADKPVGTVWISAHTPAGTVAELRHFPGDRARVIDRATTEALLLLLQHL